jgi:hypothetical protein
VPFKEMPLSVEQEALCERLMVAAEPAGQAAASLIRELAGEIDRLWDRLNRAYRDDLLHQEIRQLRAELGRAREQLTALSCNQVSHS